jgi:hypothetical protein
MLARGITGELQTVHLKISRCQKNATSIYPVISNIANNSTLPRSASRYLYHEKEYQKMSSKQKRKIARQNGAKAAGSKSPEGLQKSSMNALRYGLTAMTLVLSNESQAKFDHMLQAYIARFQPIDEIELNLVDEMVAARWRQQRIWMIQTASMNSEMDKQEEYIEETFIKCTEPTRIGIAFMAMGKDNALEQMMRYETSYSRMHDRAMKALERLQGPRFNAANREQEQDAEPAGPKRQNKRPEARQENQEDQPEAAEPKPEPVTKPAVPTTSNPTQPKKQNLQNEAKDANPARIPQAIKPTEPPDDLPATPKV